MSQEEFLAKVCNTNLRKYGNLLATKVKYGNTNLTKSLVAKVFTNQTYLKGDKATI
jgi:hypothetical protein